MIHVTDEMIEAMAAQYFGKRDWRSVFSEASINEVINDLREMMVAGLSVAPEHPDLERFRWLADRCYATRFWKHHFEMLFDDKPIDLNLYSLRKVIDLKRERDAKEEQS